MPSFTTHRQVRFSPEQMFALVADVEKYPEFLPLCEGLRVRERSVDGQGREVLVADMTCGYKAIRESFTSRVTLDRERSHIVVAYIDGPFRYLENNWVFAGHAKGCEVKFDISYEFKSRMLGLLVGGLFDTAFRKFADAFEARAAHIYRADAAASSEPGPVLASDEVRPLTS